MSLEGRLQRFWMEDVFGRLAAAEKTGILTVHGEQDIIAVSFLDGRVVFADALNDPVEEGLGDVLTQGGLVSAEEYEALVAEHRAGGARVVDLLVEKGHASRQEVLAALRRQCFDLLLQLSQATDGEFKFYDGQEVFFEEDGDPISVPEVLIRCAWALGDQGPLPQPVPLEDTVPDRRDGESTESTEPVDATAGSLGEVWDRIDGRRTAAQLSALGDLSPYDVYLALFRWAHAGRIVLSESESVPAGVVAEAESAGWGIAEEDESRSAGIFEFLEPRIARSAPWIATLALLMLAIGLVVRLHRSPVHFVCPLPWEEAERGRLIQGRRELLYQRIDNAAKTFFLIEKRFPENLQVLVDAGLLHGGDLVEPEGYDLEFISTETGYVVQPLAMGRPLAETGRTDGVAGNFLLDARYLLQPTEPAEAALVLLD